MRLKTLNERRLRGKVWLTGSALLALLCAATSAPSLAQHTVSIRVVDDHSGRPITGASVVVSSSGLGASTDSAGLANLSNLPTGVVAITVSHIGFETATVSIAIPVDPDRMPLEIALEEHHESLSEVIVGATRTSRTIAEVPTRVETVAGEEIDEKISMDPSNISMILSESPGIMVQQTSAVSGNASIRIQGLDGRYTQLLKDGFPLYGGFSGGLSILQVPPLDLRQVEIIKGPVSTLYGGDAIAGLVNLVSRTPGSSPETEPERSVLYNMTSAGGFDLGGFLAGRSEHVGYTMLTSGNLQRPYDADEDGFTDIPRTRRLTLAPRGYYYPNRSTTLWAGLIATTEVREGGDVDAVARAAASDSGFSERSESRRLTSQLRLDLGFSEATMVTVKQSISHFDRSIVQPGHDFSGIQVATYSEVSVLSRLSGHDVVGGVDLRTEKFDHTNAREADLDFQHLVIGAFVQDTWFAGHRLGLESGIRMDYHDRHGVFLLPRTSILYRITDRLSARLTGGFGYKPPTVFLEPSEERAFKGVSPLDEHIKAETSFGGTFDVNYSTVLFGEVALAFNQAAYFTQLDNALIPAPFDATGAPADALHYVNAGGPMRTHGLETNARLSRGDLKLFLGYVYLVATLTDGGDQSRLALTPANKTFTVLVWERHGRGRVGLEAYYTGPQYLSNGERVPGYWVTGIMAELFAGPTSLFLNLENFLDTQQSDFSPMVSGPRSTPVFAEVWAPTDGFVVNGGVKLRL